MEPPTLLSIGFSHSVILLFPGKKHLRWPQPQGLLRTSSFLSSSPLPPGWTQEGRGGLHSGHERNEKEGSQRKKWSFIAGGRLSIFIPYLMEFPTGGSFFLLPTPSPTSLPSPSEALEGDPLFVTSHLHTQPP